MPCYSPLTAYFADEFGGSPMRSRPGPTKRRALVFDERKSHSGVPVRIGCGQCIGCRLEHARQWAMRCVHEQKMHSVSRFLTLTYDDEHMPKHGMLVKRDLQLFMKRLRKAYGERRIRFFGCGEYGDRNNRPHYHLLLFGHAFEDERRHSTSDSGEPLRVSRICERLWPAGHSIIGDVSFDSACYVAGYVLKKVTGDRADEHYRKVLRDGTVVRMAEEFVLMSRRPGVGTSYYERFGAEAYVHDSVIMKERAVPPPKFYDGKLRESDPDLLERLKKVRRRAIDLAEQTSTRRRVREKIVTLNMGRFQRDVT